MDLEKRILDEFGTYYLADELPRNDEHWRDEVLPLWAEQSAERIGAALDGGQRRQLAALLRAIAGDREHPLVNRLIAETAVSWTDDDDSWSQLVRILSSIAHVLEGGSRVERHELELVDGVVRHRGIPFTGVALETGPDAEQSYWAGVPHGASRTFYPNGRLARELHARFGIVVSRKDYDERGLLVDELRFAEDGHEARYIRARERPSSAASVREAHVRYQLPRGWVYEDPRTIVGPAALVELSALTALPPDPQLWIDQAMARGIAQGARVQALSDEKATTVDGWGYTLLTASVRVDRSAPEIRVGAFYRFWQHGAHGLARIWRASATTEAKALFASAHLELPRDLDVALLAFWSPTGRVP